jgi:hypothetical protein
MTGPGAVSEIRYQACFLAGSAATNFEENVLQSYQTQ